MINLLGTLRNYRFEIWLSLLSSFLLTISFPGYNQNWAAWIAFLPLFYAIRKQPARPAFLLGLLTGVGHYLSLLYWLIPTMHTYGKLPVWTGCLLLLLLSVYLGLYLGGFSLMVRLFSGNPVFLPLWSAGLLVSLEYLRAYLLSGFPWELMGYSQYQQLNLIQISDITGVYGISFLIGGGNGTLFLGTLCLFQKKWKGHTVNRRKICMVSSVSASLIFLTLAYGHFRIKETRHRMHRSPQAAVAVVQGNIDQSLKWEPAFQRSTIIKYLRLSHAAGDQDPALIVWPETAAPFFYSSPYSSRHLKALIREGTVSLGTWLLFGSPSYKRAHKTAQYFNTAYLLNPDGKRSGSYDKVHLVPYGEYIPLKKWFPFLGKLVAQVGDFKAGEKGKTLIWNHHRIGVQICFEILFPELARTQAANQAKLLVNITNDAWFGASSGPYQHFSMTVFRAVENKRALVRSANTGISGFIDPTGQIMNTTELFTNAVRTRTVPLMSRPTLYMQVGDLFAKICLLSVCIFGIFWFIKHRWTPPQNR